MTTDHVSGPHDGEDLERLREKIDELKATPHDELVSPIPAAVEEKEPAPRPTDAIGSERWDEPASDETTDL